MPAAKDSIPRTDMTADQRRRIGAVQVASRVLFGDSYNVTAELKVNSVDEILAIANFVVTGDT